MNTLRCRYLLKCINLLLVLSCLASCHPMRNKGKAHAVTSKTPPKENTFKYNLLHTLNEQIDDMEWEITQLDHQLIAQKRKKHFFLRRHFPRKQSTNFLDETLLIKNFRLLERNIHFLDEGISAMNAEVQKKRVCADKIRALLNDFDNAVGKRNLLSQRISQMENSISQFDEALRTGDADELERHFEKLSELYIMKLHFNDDEGDFPKWHEVTGVPKQLYSELHQAFHNHALVKILVESRFEIYDMHNILKQIVSDLKSLCNYDFLLEYAREWFGAFFNIQQLGEVFEKRKMHAIKTVPFKESYRTDENAVYTSPSQPDIAVEGSRDIVTFTLPFEGTDWKELTSTFSRLKLALESLKVSISSSFYKLLSNSGKYDVILMDSSAAKHSIQWYNDATRRLNNNLICFRKKLMKSILDSTKGLGLNFRAETSLDSIDVFMIMKRYIVFSRNKLDFKPIFPVVSLDSMQLELDNDRKLQPLEFMAPLDSFPLTMHPDDYQSLFDAYYKYEMARVLCEFDILFYQNLNIIEKFIASKQSFLDSFDVNAVSSFLNQLMENEKLYSEKKMIWSHYSELFNHRPLALNEGGLNVERGDYYILEHEALGMLQKGSK